MVQKQEKLKRIIFQIEISKKFLKKIISLYSSILDPEYLSSFPRRSASETLPIIFILPAI